MPTLKQYLESHQINSTSDERSKIGRLISKEKDSSFQSLEDGYWVKNYKLEFLESESTQMIIISFFKYLT